MEGEVSQLNWIISAFNLTSAAFIPFWGQAADIFGRHTAIQAALVIMMVGSALCTAAPKSTFAVLLLGRAIQGLGCAGLNVVVRVILLDRVSLRENAKNWSIFSFTAGMSYGVGPVVGGALTNVNWRWCFAVNLPICVAALALIYIVLRPELLGPQTQEHSSNSPLPEAAAGRSSPDSSDHFEPPSVRSGPVRPHMNSLPTRLSTPIISRIASIDIGGQLLFLFGLGLLILSLTWAGATYGWATAAVLVPLCAGLVLVAAFVGYEHFMAPGRLFSRMWPHQKPMLPWTLFGSKDIGLLFYINFATGAAMYSLYGPTYAGTQLLFYTPGLGIGVYLSMYFLNGWPRNTFVPLMLGSIVEAVGVGILAWALWNGHLPAIFGMMALTGAGTGLRLMPASLHAVGFFPQHVATVVSLMAVALPLGGTLAITVMAAVFNNTSGIASSSPLRTVKTLNELPPDALANVVHRAKMGIVWAYVAITPFMITCVITALFLGNVQIAKDAAKRGKAAKAKISSDIVFDMAAKDNNRHRKRRASSASLDGVPLTRNIVEQLAEIGTRMREMHDNVLADLDLGGFSASTSNSDSDLSDAEGFASEDDELDEAYLGLMDGETEMERQRTTDSFGLSPSLSVASRSSSPPGLIPSANSVGVPRQRLSQLRPIADGHHPVRIPIETQPTLPIQPPVPPRSSDRVTALPDGPSRAVQAPSVEDAAASESEKEDV
ncbi:tetracycline efflux protein [Sporothrix brasiliensis 5110]|uniref:Tetracycline efflux protein n=1 Tax=Sporothrix brasiliensis 5110 TaxID=1398154 RepID=A0A0C2IR41_9PEZI|nr:tetracycline efflux protein [Sporothrix brasiliensis 5110]KIH91481.1 tetracycline efflux protein [Sporothrix brasiliensis 5110]